MLFGMVSTAARDEALLVLEGRGMILDFAREESAMMRQKGIGGSVFAALHGHVRTTVDVDVFVPEPPEQFAEALKAAGFAFDSGRTVHQVGRSGPSGFRGSGSSPAGRSN